MTGRKPVPERDMNPLTKAIKTLHALGFPKAWWYAVYQLGLRTGHYRRVTPSGEVEMTGKPGLKPIAGYPPVSDAQSDLRNPPGRYYEESPAFQ